MNDTGIVDSVSIVDTRTINNKMYYEFLIKSSGHTESFPSLFYDEGVSVIFLRDSSGYLIQENGKIKFTCNDYSERIVRQDQNSNYTIYEKLSANTENITVNAGTYTAQYSERYAKDNESGEQLGELDKIHYAENIGLIQETCSFVNSGGIFAYRKLESYDFQ